MTGSIWNKLVLTCQNALESIAFQFSVLLILLVTLDTEIKGLSECRILVNSSPESKKAHPAGAFQAKALDYDESLLMACLEFEKSVSIPASCYEGCWWRRARGIW